MAKWKIRSESNEYSWIFFSHSQNLWAASIRLSYLQRKAPSLIKCVYFTMSKMCIVWYTEFIDWTIKMVKLDSKIRWRLQISKTMSFIQNVHVIRQIRCGSHGEMRWYQLLLVHGTSFKLFTWFRMFHDCQQRTLHAKLLVYCCFLHSLRLKLNIFKSIFF